jgi:hypothetical protein
VALADNFSTEMETPRIGDTILLQIEANELHELNLSGKDGKSAFFFFQETERFVQSHSANELEEKKPEQSWVSRVFRQSYRKGRGDSTAR